MEIRELPKTSSKYLSLWMAGVSLSSRYSEHTIRRHSQIIRKYLGDAVDIRNPLPRNLHQINR